MGVLLLILTMVLTTILALALAQVRIKALLVPPNEEETPRTALMHLVMSIAAQPTMVPSKSLFHS